MKRTLSLVPFLLTALAASASASAVVEVGFDLLSRSAANVVSGEILSIVSERGDNGMVYSNVTLRVTRSVPQRLVGRPMTVRMIGGEMNGRRVYVEGMPRFEIGDEVVLFLNREPASVLGPTVGLWQGVFFLGRDKATGEEFILDHRRRPVTGLASDHSLMRGARLPEGVSLKSLSLEGGREPLAADRFFDRVRDFRSSPSTGAQLPDHGHHSHSHPPHGQHEDH